MKTKIFSHSFLILLVCLLFSSCKKEDPINSLNFSVVKQDGTYHFDWTATNISTFERYYVFHSPFPLGIDEDVHNLFPTRRSIINDQTVNSVDLFLPPEEGVTLYFQLLIDIGDRYVRSETIVVENDKLEVVDVGSVHGIHVPEKNALYYFQNSINKFVYYDYAKKEVKKEKILNFPLGLYNSIYVDIGFGEEIYSIDNSELIILNANTLEKKGSYIASEKIFSVAVNNGLIVLSVRDSEKPIQIISRETMTLLNSTSTYNGYYNGRGVTALKSNDNLFVEFGQNVINYYELGEQGEILNHLQGNNNFTESTSYTLSTVSPLGNFIINAFQGQIYDGSANQITELSQNSGDYYSNFFFEEDESFVYALSYIFSSSTEYHINKYSIPDFELVEQKVYLNKMPLNLFYRDGILHLAYYSLNYNCIIIEPFQ